MKHLERLKARDVTGITDNVMHSRITHQLFLDVIKVLEQELGLFEETDKDENENGNLI
ncbi:hypothetical protein [Ureibacillus endophyticus]|uniref:hypothetical protein n=1 Tax=Ureibacillus endophyticus TaxID=1978490 RepID=UPI001472BB5B|nr:hypothetical protein [Lysinibacillus endophyticus]